MFNIKIDVDKNDLMQLQKFPAEFKKGLLKGVRDSMFFVEAAVKTRFGRPGELGVRTGNLRRSIQSGMKGMTDSIVGWIGSNVVYAKIHELGGVIRPRTKKYLRFQIEGQWKTVKEVIIPARPFLEPSINENIEKIKSIIRSSIIREVGER